MIAAVMILTVTLECCRCWLRADPGNKLVVKVIVFRNRYEATTVQEEAEALQALHAPANVPALMAPVLWTRKHAFIIMECAPPASHPARPALPAQWRRCTVCVDWLAAGEACSWCCSAP